MLDHKFIEILFYWLSFPSSGGDFDDPGDPSGGDQHFWQVWNGDKPFTYIFSIGTGISGKGRTMYGTIKKGA